ncbi:Otogelin [Frankliniella fusca]|uniref:Otogelin n=1 Tax=Frankliniella fusca TaxID=407009 RepID=A0AAE1HFJ1_9NEOP|nr:Otogelin [Frankliniella fusca]
MRVGSGVGCCRTELGGAEDNVGESGEESEDEWNYYRVEPTGDKEPGPQNTDCGDSEEMESQLNPNAAVFIPSSPENSNHIEQPFNENLTQDEFFNKDNVMSSSFIAHDPVAAIDSSPVEDLNGKDDEVWLSSSPKKGGVPLDNVNVPPEDEFDREVSQRPGDLDVENSLNETNGSDSVFETVKKSKNILADFPSIEPTTSLEPAHPQEPGSPLLPSTPLEPTPISPEPEFEPTNVPPQDLFEPVKSEHLTGIVVSENIESEDRFELIDTNEIISSIDLQSENLQKVVSPFDAQLESPDEVKEEQDDEGNMGSKDGVQVTEVIEQDEFKITKVNDNNHFSYINEQPNDELETSETIDPDLLNEVDVSNGNLHVYKPSEDTYLQSPIVSGASDLNRERASETNLIVPTFGHGLSAIESSEPLNEAVLYSNSGFDNMMEASREISPQSHISAQSTPFESEAFNFEPVGSGGCKQDDSMPQEQLDIFSQQVDEVNSQFQPENEADDYKNDLNKGFAEEWKSADGVLGPDPPSKPVHTITVEEPAVLSNQNSSKSDVLPEKNEFSNSDAVVCSDHDGIIETIKSPEILESKHVDLTFNDSVPDVCEFPTGVAALAAGNVSGQHQNTSQDLVNGIGEAVGIETSLSVSEFPKEVKTTESAENKFLPAPTQDLINGVGETTEVAASVSETVLEPVATAESNSMPEIPVVDLDNRDKKPLTNGDAPKSAAAKPLSRPPTRPVTAPAGTATSTKPMGSRANTAPASKAPSGTAAARSVPAKKAPLTTAAPKPKPASTVSEAKLKPSSVTGVAAKPRPATASSMTSAKSTLSAKIPPSKPIDKQTKESTNKLISATRTTVSRTASKTASKTSVSTNGTAAKSTSTSTSSKPQPIKKPISAPKEAVEKKSSDKTSETITNGILKNGHATPEEIPVQNGVSHNEPVIDKRESDLKIESPVDNQLIIQEQSDQYGQIGHLTELRT